MDTIAVGTEKLHYFAPMFMFHELGLLCVKYNKFRALLYLMKTIVPAPNPFSPSYSFSLAYSAGTAHWDYSSLNIYMGTTWLYPYSHLVRDGIYPFIEKSFLNKEEFESCYAAWEHLFSLMFDYYRCNIIGQGSFPTGEFMLRKRDIMHGMENFYSRFIKQVLEERDKWEPLKQGLFDGDFEKFMATYNEAEEYYKRNYRQ